jgi:hypothetical protein
MVAWSSGQDSGGFEPGLRTFRMLIATIFCNALLSSGEVALPLKYLNFVREQFALEKTSIAT